MKLIIGGPEIRGFTLNKSVLHIIFLLQLPETCHVVIFNAVVGNSRAKLKFQAAVKEILCHKIDLFKVKTPDFWATYERTFNLLDGIFKKFETGKNSTVSWKSIQKHPKHLVELQSLAV